MNAVTARIRGLISAEKDRWGPAAHARTAQDRTKMLLRIETFTSLSTTEFPSTRPDPARPPVHANPRGQTSATCRSSRQAYFLGPMSAPTPISLRQGRL